MLPATHPLINFPTLVKLTVRRLVVLPSAGQTRQTLSPYQSDLTGTPAAQNAVYAVRGEQRRGFTALPLAPVVDIFLELTAHVDASALLLVGVACQSLPLSHLGADVSV